MSIEDVLSGQWRVIRMIEKANGPIAEVNAISRDGPRGESRQLIAPFSR